MADNERDIDREIRINELKEEANELAGGEMIAWESENAPDSIVESFWQRVVDYEKTPLTSSFLDLTEQGFELPGPEEIPDEEITAKLWQLLHKLAAMGTYVSQTDHLSDRELYEHLWHESLREAHPQMPPNPRSAWHIDILGGCSEEDIQLQMKYYADEEERQHWMTSFPDYEMPAHEDPPYNRDKDLPKWKYG